MACLVPGMIAMRPKTTIKGSYCCGVCSQDFMVPYNAPDATTFTSVDGFTCELTPEAQEVLKSTYASRGGKGSMFIGVMKDVGCLGACCPKKQKGSCCAPPPIYLTSTPASSGFIISDGTNSTIWCVPDPLRDPTKICGDVCPLICTPPHIEPEQITVTGFDMDMHKGKWKKAMGPDAEDMSEM